MEIGVGNTCRLSASSRTSPYQSIIWPGSLHGISKDTKGAQDPRNTRKQHEIYGKTFQTLRLGQKPIYTAHLDNPKAVYGTLWEDWGTGRADAMEEFAGKASLPEMVRNGVAIELCLLQP